MLNDMSIFFVVTIATLLGGIILFFALRRILMIFITESSADAGATLIVIVSALSLVASVTDFSSGKNGEIDANGYAYVEDQLASRPSSTQLVKTMLADGIIDNSELDSFRLEINQTEARTTKERILESINAQTSPDAQNASSDDDQNTETGQ